MSQEPVLKNRSQERRKNTPEDFMFGKLIGEGSFSTVFLVREVSGNKRELACKVCDKKQIQKENKTKYILSEKVMLFHNKVLVGGLRFLRWIN
jgi:3-phosphoinositide dependent protein kinase-1